MFLNAHFIDDVIAKKKTNNNTVETPDRVQMPRSRIRPNIIEPSPRIDAITINNKLR